MNYYGLIGNLKAKKGKGHELASILLEAANTLEKAQGCYQYMVAQAQQDPENIWVTEIWSSKADHDASLKLDGVNELIQKAMLLIAEPPQSGTETNLLGGVNKPIVK